MASIFDPKIVLKKHRTYMNKWFNFRTLEGVSSTSGRSGPAECARCVKRSRLGAVAWRGLAQGARRLKHAQLTASGGRRIVSANAGTRRPSISGTQWQQAQRPWKAKKKLGNEVPGVPKQLPNEAPEAPKLLPGGLWATFGVPSGEQSGWTYSRAAVEG